MRAISGRAVAALFVTLAATLTASCQQGALNESGTAVAAKQQSPAKPTYDCGTEAEAAQRRELLRVGMEQGYFERVEWVDGTPMLYCMPKFFDMTLTIKQKSCGAFLLQWQCEGRGCDLLLLYDAITGATAGAYNHEMGLRLKDRRG